MISSYTGSLPRGTSAFQGRAINPSVESVYEEEISLDSEADVWINDIYLGHQRSAFYPFTADVTLAE